MTTEKNIVQVKGTDVTGEWVGGPAQAVIDQVHHFGSCEYGVNDLVVLERLAKLGLIRYRGIGPDVIRATPGPNMARRAADYRPWENYRQPDAVPPKNAPPKNVKRRSTKTVSVTPGGGTDDAAQVPEKPA